MNKNKDFYIPKLLCTIVTHRSYMYLNRFALDIKPYGIETSFIKGRPLYIIEEVLFYLLPKKIYMGGYGFLHLRIYTGSKSENTIFHGGQTIDFEYKKNPLPLIKFRSMSMRQQFNYFLDIIEEVIQEISLSLKIDKEKFDIAIATCRKIWPIRFEEILKISKTHPNKKIKIDFVRVLEYTGESLIYRIKNKDNIILKEHLLLGNSSIYNVKYDYKRSKWESDKLLIFDRFDKKILEIDISNNQNE